MTIHDDDDDLNLAAGPPARRPAARPATRPAMIWWVSSALVLFGLLGAALSGAVYQELASDDEEGLVVALAVLAILLSLFQVACGLGVFLGAGWSRNAARALCGLSVAGGGLLLLTAGGPGALLGVIANFVLLVALSGEMVQAWCGE